MLNELVTGSVLFAPLLTLAAYQAGLWCQRKWKNPVFNPILIAVVLVLAVLTAAGIPNSTYQAGTGVIGWLLTPATVCLAIPLYEQLQILRRDLPAILAGVAAGTATSLAVVFGMVKLFGFDRPLAVSLLPKSITTAMGIVLSELQGGVPAITTAAIIVTGILGSLAGTTLCKVLKLDDPVARGVAFGTASHVVGTSKASELSDLTGAVSSLSLTVAGILTAVCFSGVAGMV